jgi:hypothetical protein
MKKYILSLAALSAMTFGLASCQQGGNADELMKQDQEKVNAKVQSMTDEMNASMDKACQDKIDSVANVNFASTIETATPEATKNDAHKGSGKKTPKTFDNGKPVFDGKKTDKGGKTFDNGKPLFDSKPQTEKGGKTFDNGKPVFK